MKRNGYTLPEITIITGIFLMLFGFVVINLVNSQQSTSIRTIAQTLIADIKSQQLKAMSGSTEGRATADRYGIHLETTSYTLFHGTTYTANDSTNVVVNLDHNIQFFNVMFPNQNIIFSQGSGEVSGFQTAQNTVTLKDTNSTNQKTITINRYGTILSVN